MIYYEHGIRLHKLRFALFLLCGIAVAQQIDYITQVKNRPMVDIRSYGAKGDGTTDSTSAIQTAITLAQTYGNIVWIPPGTWKVSSEITITDGVVIQCAGSGSTIKTSHATANIFHINNPFNYSAVQINNCYFDASVTRTGGAAILAGDLVINYGTKISNVFIRHMYNGIELDSAYGYVIRDSTITDSTHQDIIMKGALAKGANDGLIIGNFIDSPLSTNLIYLEDVGGVKIQSNKLLFGANMIEYTNTNTGGYSDLLISNNSIEGATTRHIWLRRINGNTYGFLNAQIIGNQITSSNGTSIGIEVTSNIDTTAFRELLISGNIFQHDKTEIKTNSEYCRISGNYIIQFGVSSSVGIDTTGSGLIDIHDNFAQGQGFNYILSANTVLKDTTSFIAFSQLAGLAISPGSYIYCGDCNATCSAGSGSGQHCFRNSSGSWYH